MYLTDTHCLRLKYRRYFLMILSCLLAVTVLNACGFKLRGSLDLSEDLSPIYLQQNSLFELGRQIKPLLLTNNVEITENAAEASAQLTLISESKERRVLSVDSNGQAREYLLTYKANFAIKIKALHGNKERNIEDSISISRSLLFDQDAVLAVSNETEVLYKDMQRNAARLILLRMQAKTRNSSTVNKPANTAEDSITQ